MLQLEKLYVLETWVVEVLTETSRIRNSSCDKDNKGDGGTLLSGNATVEVTAAMLSDFGFFVLVSVLQ